MGNAGRYMTMVYLLRCSIGLAGLIIIFDIHHQMYFKAPSGCPGNFKREYPNPLFIQLTPNSVPP